MKLRHIIALVLFVVAALFAAYLAVQGMLNNWS